MKLNDVETITAITKAVANRCGVLYNDEILQDVAFAVLKNERQLSKIESWPKLVRAVRNDIGDQYRQEHRELRAGATVGPIVTEPAAPDGEFDPQALFAGGTVTAYTAEAVRLERRSWTPDKVQFFVRNILGLDPAKAKSRRTAFRWRDVERTTWQNTWDASPMHDELVVFKVHRTGVVVEDVNSEYNGRSAEFVDALQSWHEYQNKKAEYWRSFLRKVSACPPSARETDIERRQKRLLDVFVANLDAPTASALMAFLDGAPPEPERLETYVAAVHACNLNTFLS